MLVMLAGMKRKFDRFLFNWRCKGVYNTPLVKCDPNSDVLIVSQLFHPDMTMYMLAAKSLARFIKPQGFVIVDDGLLDEDKQVLEEHFESIRFVSSKSMRLGTCPVGGCWERLLTLGQENVANYVIQLDSDTLTLAEPTEVSRCIEEGRSFTLGTNTGTHPIGLEEASRYAHLHTCEHVQNQAERALGEYPGKDNLKYVRGCAGFTGFAKGELTLLNIEEFSTRMEKIVGKEKWREWGSEQVASNFMAANAPDSLVLPVERYPFWKPGVEISQAVFVHFFGTYRFANGMYTRQGLQIIKRLTP